MSEAGYAGKILKIDLSTGKISRLETSDYAPKYLGGRGIAARIYWDEVKPEVGALDPENRLMFFNGALTGFAGLASSRWQVVGKSPATDKDNFCYASFGGNWGAQLKFAGYDGVVFSGKAEKPVTVVINDDNVQIKDASSLWGKGAINARKTLKAQLGDSFSVLSSGIAGDHLVAYSTLMADNDAVGSCGFGAVMGSKNLKAVAVKGSHSLKPAQPDKLRELVKYFNQLLSGRTQASESGRVPNAKTSREPCWGCPIECNRIIYETADGTRGKFTCQASNFYGVRAFRYYNEKNDVAFRATRFCDDYGLDTNVVEVMIMWLSRCLQAGILNDENTGIPLSKMGSLEFIDTFLLKTAKRDGFGDILANGLVKAAQAVGKNAFDLVTDYTLKASQSAGYEPRLYQTAGLLYAMDSRQPIQQLHEVSRLAGEWVRHATKPEETYMNTELYNRIAKWFWGSEAAGDFSTYEGKAMSAKNVQDRQLAKESLGLCDLTWPIMHVKATEDHFGDPTLEAKVLSAVTGNQVDEQGLLKYGERIMNMQRAIFTREGQVGRKGDQLPEKFFTTPLKSAFANPENHVPGADGKLISKKGAVVERDKFEQMKTEYYQLRGWDPESGLQTKKKLDELGMSDVAAELKKIGALA